ncbi:MAG: CBS domain-containing protein, partial [Promethearchaeota archaeon]
MLIKDYFGLTRLTGSDAGKQDIDSVSLAKDENKSQEDEGRLIPRDSSGDGLIDITDDIIIVSTEDTLANVAKLFLSSDTTDDVGVSGMMAKPILTGYVMDDKRLVGMINRNDIIRAMVINNLDLSKTRVKDVMRKPVSCSPYDKVDDVINTMLDNGLLTIAVMDGERFLGVI